MKIFNIYTIENQEMYRKEQNAMILAHLLEQHKYEPENFENCSHIIMDNGVYEHAQVSQDLEKLIELALNSGINVNEIVIPDVIGNYEKSKDLFVNQFATMKKYHDKFSFMYVSHASTLDELAESVTMLNKLKATSYVKLVLGIPKHSQLNRASFAVYSILAKCKVPVHFLGIKENYAELFTTKAVLRSCDSVQLTYLTREYSVSSKDLLDKTRKGDVIDLSIDKVNPTKLALMRVAVNKELKKHGIL